MNTTVSDNSSSPFVPERMVETSWNIELGVFFYYIVRSWLNVGMCEINMLSQFLVRSTLTYTTKGAEDKKINLVQYHQQLIGQKPSFESFGQNQYKCDDQSYAHSTHGLWPHLVADWCLILSLQISFSIFIPRGLYMYLTNISISCIPSRPRLIHLG